jgi:PLP dependent protein
MTDMTDIASRLEDVRRRVEAAAARRGGSAAVTLIGVSKKQPLSSIEAAIEAGLADFGENYAQELRDKRAALGHAHVTWHFIGPLQSNKVKYVVDRDVIVHTIDRPSVLDAIERRAAPRDLVVDVLVQVDIAGEAGKSGIDPAALPALLDRFADLEHVRCRGLMLIPPQGSPEATRPHFAALRQLRDQLAATTRPNVDLHELSMGMSADFEVAIEEGATLVRVGTSIFGDRPRPE